MAAQRHAQERALLSHGRDIDGQDLHVWRQRRVQQRSEAVEQSSSLLLLDLLAQGRIGVVAVDLQCIALIPIDSHEVSALGAKKKADLEVTSKGGIVESSPSTDSVCLWSAFTPDPAWHHFPHCLHQAPRAPLRQGTEN